MQTGESIILYTSEDERSSVALYARDGSVWLNQLQVAELFATSRQNREYHIANIRKGTKRIFSCKGIFYNCLRWQKIQSHQQLDAIRADEEDMHELLELEEELKRR